MREAELGVYANCIDGARHPKSTWPTAASSPDSEPLANILASFHISNTYITA